VHIPLDYYRVLGLPIQATAEQLSHAHRDRTLQLPRREFSEWAIAARREIIDEAYEILSDPVERPKYDANFLSKPYDMDTVASDESSLPIDSSAGSENENIDGADSPVQPDGEPVPARPDTPPLPRIEIQDRQFIGALLLLYELGEYELALKLGRPYLSSGAKSLSEERFGDPQIVAADIVLTISLSCLELGREQWQQGQYEAAAESLETGQELLLREGLFASVRGEIQSDLYKLRPYRILELLALPEERSAERYQGLRLLSDILQERGGIDGKNNDQSGLSTDDFLRFIQQLRSYLSVAEQQQIFEAEAKRPSAVGTYLAVYTLIAGGFARRQPVRIRSAKALLDRLGHRQDIRLEQSVCALLLGQTEEASDLVEQSREEETLTYIRKHSEGSPDLLPGLCLYTEQWLRVEVFPQFRDLREEDASLKGYFADPTVQAYLESLPVQENEPQTAVAYQDTRQRRGTTEERYIERDRTYSTVQAAESYQRQPATVGAGSTATATRNGNGGHGTSTLHPAEQ